MTSEFPVLGKSVVRKDAVEKVKGTKYVSDMQLPGMLHTKIKSLGGDRIGLQLN